MSGPLVTVDAAWGPDAPDWVRALATACEQTSQAKAAKLIGRSPALVSQVLHGRYQGDMANVEEAVRASVMGAVVVCPALGSLKLLECRNWREKSKAFASTNSLRVMMFRACNRCPLNREDT